MGESPRPFAFVLPCPWTKYGRPPDILPNEGRGHLDESTGKRQDYAETWEGGFIRHDSQGRKVYVIRRMINGRNYKVSTRATTLRAAIEQLKRFEIDPEHYNPVGSPHEQPISTHAVPTKVPTLG